MKDNGNLELLYGKDGERAFAYCRGGLLMMCNPSGQEAVLEEKLLSGPNRSKTELLSGRTELLGAEKLFEIGSTEYADGRFTLGAQSFVIWQI